MRNLLEYPITHDEVIDVIDYLYRDAAEEMRCGDLRPMVIRSLKTLAGKYMPEILDDLEVKLK